MKAFNFDEPTERRGTGSYKWDSADADVIPLWVADMDFRTAPCIIDALSDRVRHGVFGYEKVPDAWYEALQGWFARRHGWQIRREEVLCTTGVVPAVSAVIKAFTRPGDGVALMTPAYNCFFSSIRNNGCFAAETALLMGNAGWTIDFAALEKTLADPRVKVFLFCSPHNPVSRVWTADEIRRTAQIAHQAGVLFVCDEIHGEFVFGGSRYLPAAQVEGVDPLRTVILTSPTKTFNLAGAGIAAIIAAGPRSERRLTGRSMTTSAATSMCSALLRILPPGTKGRSGSKPCSPICRAIWLPLKLFLPKNCRSAGFPSSKALTSSGQTCGQCWART